MNSRIVRHYLFVVFLSAISFAGKAQDFYKTPSGKKYHLGSCRMVENVAQKITAAETVELGLDACKICRPDLAGTKQDAANAPRGQGQTTQCKGKTKAGTRCKHMTRIANGYCFQHNPDKR